MFLPLPLAIWLSLVLAVLTVSDFDFVPPASLCDSTPGRPVLSRKNLGMKGCGAGSTLECRPKPEEYCPQMFLGSCDLMVLAVFLLARNLNRSGGFTCAHRHVDPSGISFLSWCYLGMDPCVRGSAQLAQKETRRLLSQAAPMILCPEGSWWISLSSSGGFSCTHRLVDTPVRIAFFLHYSGMDPYGWHRDVKPTVLHK